MVVALGEDMASEPYSGIAPCRQLSGSFCLGQAQHPPGESQAAPARAGVGGQSGKEKAYKNEK